MDISARAIFSVGVTNDVVRPKRYLDTCLIFNFPTKEHYKLYMDMARMQDVESSFLKSLEESSPLLKDVSKIPSSITSMQFRLRFSGCSHLHLIHFPVGVYADQVSRDMIEMMINEKSPEELRSFLESSKM